MPSPERVVIAFAKGDSDQRAAHSLTVGFTRDGVQVWQTTQASEVLDLLERHKEAPDVVVASLQLEGPDDGLALTRAVRARHSPGVAGDLARPPIILIGDGDRRAAALEAGASLFVPKPAYVKDLVTLAGILAMAREGLTPGWGGELGALHLYYVVRALGAARKTGVLTLTRNHRRGELRFFEGEVTSAQVGMLHGQAAFHQLLLWPEAHFDLRVEQVVRREQIPLAPAELLQDAERFLRDFNELAQGISPASIYEQDLRKVAEHIDDIPREVVPVLRLFDGIRSVADVIEDSSVRMGETLHIVKKLIALGVVTKHGATRAHLDATSALHVEDWLVGQTTDPGKIRKSGETAAAAPPSDWNALGQPPAWEVASYAPVVPAKTTTGEIKVPDVATGSTEPVPAEPKVAAALDRPERKGQGRDREKKNGKQRGRAAKAVDAVTVDPALADTPSRGVDPARDAAAAVPVPVAPDTEVTAEAPRRLVTARTRATSGEIEVQAPPPPPDPGPARAPAIEVSKDLPSEVLPPQSLIETQPTRPTQPLRPPPAVASAEPRVKPARKPAPQPEQPGIDRFHDHEEKFFSEEEHFARAEAPAAESFADLDDGHARREPFWKRLLKKLVVGSR
jgi:CheY-like chemotaxis protein